MSRLTCSMFGDRENGFLSAETTENTPVQPLTKEFASISSSSAPSLHLREVSPTIMPPAITPSSSIPSTITPTTAVALSTKNKKESIRRRLSYGDTPNKQVCARGDSAPPPSTCVVALPNVLSGIASNNICSPSFSSSSAASSVWLPARRILETDQVQLQVHITTNNNNNSSLCSYSSSQMARKRGAGTWSRYPSDHFALVVDLARGAKQLSDALLCPPSSPSSSSSVSDNGDNWSDDESEGWESSDSLAIVSDQEDQSAFVCRFGDNRRCVLLKKQSVVANSSIASSPSSVG